MTAPEQVADLREGDVVELRHPDADWTITGPLVPLFNGLGVAGWAVTETHPDSINAQLNVRIVSRAPRPLYVNHPRTEPVAGDVVRDELGNGMALLICTHEEDEVWWLNTSADWIAPAEMQSKRLRLLVDGETGQVVP